MLESLYIKNFALIKEVNIDFHNHLNILTGETGSGKSILIDSINLALGKRASKDIIRDGDNEVVISLSFVEKNKDILDQIKELDIPIEDDNKIVLYRRISQEKNLSKINDIPCTLTKIKNVAELLIDIYGQHDSEDLRKNAKHITFLDEFIGDEIIPIKKEIINLFNSLKNEKEKLSVFNLDERMRLREIDILNYEIEELKNINFKPGEEEELSDKLKIVQNSKNIIDSLSASKSIIHNIDFGKVIKELKYASKYDTSLNELCDMCYDAESLINDISSEIEDKYNNYDVNEYELKQIEERLNSIRSVLSKYHNSIDEALSELENKQNRLDLLNNYEEDKNKVNLEIERITKELENKCEELSIIRKKNSIVFVDKLVNELKYLGFNDCRFNIEITKKDNFTKDGYDDCVFYISLNTGEKLRPLSDVASGGELSRIMLSIKTILSKAYGTDTLIFDEVDQGISGITASKVAKKLNKIAVNKQVICITHLPQIASMADSHYEIKKEVNNNRTNTIVKELDELGMINEIGRLIGNSEVLTDSVLNNAKELKKEAKMEKEKNGNA